MTFGTILAAAIALGGVGLANVASDESASRRQRCQEGVRERLESAAGGMRAYSMLTRDGRRMVSRLEGTNTVYELVPTNQLPANLPPIEARSRTW